MKITFDVSAQYLIDEIENSFREVIETDESLEELDRKRRMWKHALTSDGTLKMLSIETSLDPNKSKILTRVFSTVLQQKRSEQNCH